MDRMVSFRQLTNGAEASFRRFVWCDNDICEERNALGSVTKRFYQQGVKQETGPNAGTYFYSRDHLGSVRELTDGNGNVRVRYAYDPFGRRTKIAGDLESDFGFTGLFFASEVNLAIARFRSYDSDLGRWLTRDLLRQAELKEGPNLYAYVANNPVNATDPLVLEATSPGASPSGEDCCSIFKWLLEDLRAKCPKAKQVAAEMCAADDGGEICDEYILSAKLICERNMVALARLAQEYHLCRVTPCKPTCGPPPNFNPFTPFGPQPPPPSCGPMCQAAKNAVKGN
jgi:RHS repeat-associated protein